MTASNSGAHPDATGTRKPAAWKFRIRRISTPARKFMAAPAANTRTFFQKPWLLRLWGSSESSSSPSMAQKPPMGKARRVNLVPFFPSLCQTWGPMPMANSWTVTPHSRAAMKWPHSWAAISTPNRRMAIIIYMALPLCWVVIFAPDRREWEILLESARDLGGPGLRAYFCPTTTIIHDRIERS